MRTLKVLKNASDLGRELFTEFGNSNGSLIAAAVSFYTFLSLVPLLLIAVAVFGFVLRSQEQAYTTVLSFLLTYFPLLVEKGAGSTAPPLQEIIRGSGTASGIGLAALLWAGSQAFVNLEIAVNIAWDRPRRGFLKSRLLAIVLLIMVGALLLISVGITAAATAIMSSSHTIFGVNVSTGFSLLWRILAYALPLGVTIVSFTLIYKVLPNTRVPIKAALAGGIFAGVLWEMAKYGFSFYVTRFAHYSAVYGSLGGIVLLLMWISYSSLVTVLGAHLAALIFERQQPTATKR